MNPLLPLLLFSLTITTTVHAEKPSRRTLIQEGQQSLDGLREIYLENFENGKNTVYKKRDLPILGYSVEYPEDWDFSQYESQASKYGQFYYSDGDVTRMSYIHGKERNFIFIFSKQFPEVATMETVQQEWEDIQRQPDHDDVYESSHLSFLRELDNVSTEIISFKGKAALKGEYTFNNWSKFWKTHFIMFPWGNRIYTIKYREERDAAVSFDDEYLAVLDSFTFYTPEPQFGEDASSTTEGFSDLPAYHKNRKAIERLKELKILNGYDDGSIKPDNTINRAEFIKIMTSSPLLLDELVQKCSKNSFSDVPADAWFAPNVCIAKFLGMIEGYPDGTFRPEQEISFVEAAKIISTFYSTPDDILPANHSIGENWYKPFVRFLENRRAIPISIRKLSAPITRGEMSEMIYRLEDNVQGEERGLEDLE
ncbi:hypothetical protein COU75_00130 [Candidatus Peregrinibacteria bacterium CG10_big_fil_rev_8_21_14_0_10_42_8]|nr:MAG: hypothetical protein COU75_00130 [Candidatus Peregrinibacteria bacterium CG10_big_fil_rev_8_21_14_0_10_42_8]